MRTGPTNTQLQALIVELRKQASEKKSPLLKRIANDLEKPTRKRRAINLTRINVNTKENDTIVVPGKVLAGGELDHKVNVFAFSFSEEARKKIKSNKGDVLTIKDLLSKMPKNVRILG